MLFDWLYGVIVRRQHFSNSPQKPKVSFLGNFGQHYFQFHEHISFIQMLKRPQKSHKLLFADLLQMCEVEKAQSVES